MIWDCELELWCMKIYNLTRRQAYAVRSILEKRYFRHPLGGWDPDAVARIARSIKR